jgi:anthraniloyl-CoA monooxygenase
MAQYKAVDGVAQDFHLVHLGARAVGGAALVMVEMTSPAPEGRITPGCPGLWNEEQAAALNASSTSCTATARKNRSAAGPQRPQRLDLRRLGRHGRTVARRQLAADGRQRRAVWRAEPGAPRHDPRRHGPVTAQFVAATRRAAEAGFDWLELHCAHGYLLSSFICPLTNRRTDDYGGSIENRCRYPLEVFAAMRAAWPAERPMSVRISAHDWAPGGNTPDDAVVARLFKAAGCDVIDVSSGQTTREAKPVYGRMYQTPFADRIRNEVGIQTMAVGAISEADHANSIIAAGRADLCAVARPASGGPGLDAA